MTLLRLCTFNVWRDAPFDGIDHDLMPESFTHIPAQEFGKRKHVLQAFLRAFGDSVDVFALQECTPPIAAVVAESLTPFGFRQLPLSEINQEQVFYKAARLALQEGSVTAGFLDPAVDGNHATQAIFRLGEKVFALVNTHLSWQGSRTGDEDASSGPSNPRAAQMRNICRNLPDMAVVFLLGDLNDIYWPIRVAYRDARLLPSFTQLGQMAPHTCPTPTVGNPPDCEVDSFASKTYDWILSRGATVSASQCVDFNLDGVYPSDHYPVVATYEL